MPTSNGQIIFIKKKIPIRTSSTNKLSVEPTTCFVVSELFHLVVGSGLKLEWQPDGSRCTFLHNPTLPIYFILIRADVVDTFPPGPLSPPLVLHSCDVVTPLYRKIPDKRNSQVSTSAPRCNFTAIIICTCRTLAFFQLLNCAHSISTFSHKFLNEPDSLGNETMVS
jgi:hypothetical protein